MDLSTLQQAYIDGVNSGQIKAYDRETAYKAKETKRLIELHLSTIPMFQRNPINDLKDEMTRLDQQYRDMVESISKPISSIYADHFMVKMSANDLMARIDQQNRDMVESISKPITLDHYYENTLSKQSLKILKRSTSYIYAQNVPTPEEKQQLIIVVYAQKIEFMQEKIDRLEREKKDDSEIIATQARAIHRLSKAEPIYLIEQPKTTEKDATQGKAGAKLGTTNYCATKEAVFQVWLRHKKMTSGQFENKLRIICSNCADGFKLEGDNGYIHETGKSLQFSNIKNLITEFRKR